MNKQKYAVVGHPIGHTMSPFIHNKLFKLNKINAEYKIFDIKPENLKKEFLKTLKNLNGFNVTIPHKESIIKYLDSLNKKANLYKSVNTVSFNNNLSIGSNTDAYGFLKALKTSNINLNGNVVILGSGGVSRTIAYESLLNNCNVTIATRKESVSSSEKLVKELKKDFPSKNINSCYFENILNNINGDINLLINGTPVGMFPNINNQPVEDNIIKSSKQVFDAIYNPVETLLIKKAKANGSAAIGGMSMLVWQAAKAQEIWTGHTFKTEDINIICQDTVKELNKINN